jgi:hypothetical protein
MKKEIHRFSHIADIIALPFFALLILYFHGIENKTQKETLLYLFAIVAFVMDSIFTYFFYANK